MKKIFYSSIFVILNVAFLNVEAMRSESPSYAKRSAEKRAEVTKPKWAAPRRMPTGSVVNFDGSVLRKDSSPNGARCKKLRGIPQSDLSLSMGEDQPLPVKHTPHNIQHIYAEDCESSEQMVIRDVGVGRCNAVAQNQVIHFGVVSLAAFLEILRYMGRTYTISAEKILADCSGVERDVFDEIFGCGMYEINYVRDPERFLDCILSGDELELSAQEDLRQKLIKLGWSDSSAKNCQVVLSWPDDLQYEYKSVNPRLEKIIQ